MHASNPESPEKLAKSLVPASTEKPWFVVFSVCVLSSRVLPQLLPSLASMCDSASLDEGRGGVLSCRPLGFYSKRSHQG